MPTSSGSRPSVVGGDLRSELADPLCEVLLGHQDLAQVGVAGVHRAGPYCLPPTALPFPARSPSAVGGGRPGDPCRSRSPRLRPRDGQHPFDGRSLGRMVAAQPQADGASPERDRRGGEDAGVGRVELARECIEQIRVVAQQVRLAAEEVGDVALGDRVEHGKQVVPDAVAAESTIGIRLVVDGLEPELRAQLVCLGAAQRQQRSSVASHGGQAVGAGAAQEVEEHRLGLIVGGVPGEHIRGKRLVACGPSPSLEVGAGWHLHPDRMESGSPLRGDVGHHHAVLGRAGPQAVVDVDRADLTAGFHGQHEQCEGVSATRHRAGDRRPRRGEGAARQKVRPRQRASARSTRLGRGSRRATAGSRVLPMPVRAGSAPRRARPRR